MGGTISQNEQHKLYKSLPSKGLLWDDERLKQIKHFGEDYFEEMLE